MHCEEAQSGQFVLPRTWIADPGNRARAAITKGRRAQQTEAALWRPLLSLGSGVVRSAVLLLVIRMWRRPWLRMGGRRVRRRIRRQRMRRRRAAIHVLGIHTLCIRMLSNRWRAAVPERCRTAARSLFLKGIGRIAAGHPIGVDVLAAADAASGAAGHGPRRDHAFAAELVRLGGRRDRRLTVVL